MKAVIQRVKKANVNVNEKTVGEISEGFLILLGAGNKDTKADCEKLADKISKLRIFSDKNDKINLSINDINGNILIVSQFTLYADCRKGNRPSFINACEPVTAEKLYEHFIECLKTKINGKVEHGIFGADMKVSLINDGPFTVVLESINGEII